MSYLLTEQQLNDTRALAFRVLQSLPQKLDTTHFSKEAWLARAVIDLGDKLAEMEYQLRKQNVKESLQKVNEKYGEVLQRLAEPKPSEPADPKWIDPDSWGK